jgi:foldase protein PrsA
VSPSQRKRPTSGKGRGESGAAGRSSGPAPLQRLGLLVFGIAFVVLFVAVAIAEGVGHPSIPSGDVVLVQDVPSDIGHVSEADFKHALVLTAAQGSLKKVPKPGEPKYDELKEATVKSLLEPIWLQGLASEQGIEVTDQEIAAELKKIKKESFKSPAEFKKFLKESHFTPADVNERVKVQILSKKLQEQLKENVPKPSEDEVKNYYEAAKATQFTQKASRDIRVVVNKDRKKAEEARDALSKDDSAKNWKKVAKKYSEESITKASGGLKKGVTEEAVKEPLAAAYFSAPEGKVEGPIKAEGKYTVFEVVHSTAESVQDLKTVESQVQATLAQRLEQEYFEDFVSNFTNEWTARTFCASGYVIERCANYKSNGHSAEADPACYEAHPKKAPEACPAPVLQAKPALPGTVTPLEPKGKPLAQRPQPAGLKPVEEGASLEGLPPGVTGAPPTAP